MLRDQKPKGSMVESFAGCLSHLAHGNSPLGGAGEEHSTSAVRDGGFLSDQTEQDLAHNPRAPSVSSSVKGAIILTTI